MGLITPTQELVMSRELRFYMSCKKYQEDSKTQRRVNRFTCSLNFKALWKTKLYALGHDCWYVSCWAGSPFRLNKLRPMGII